MHFIRLAGCNVGKPAKYVPAVPGTSIPVEQVEEYDSPEPIPLTANGKPAWLCRTLDGRPFWCDTDFAKYEEIETGDLINATYEEHICITGGEPLLHKNVVQQLLELSRKHKKRLHIETSGTHTFFWHPEEWSERYRPWTTVSPKWGALPIVLKKADEIKLVVDPRMKMETLYLPMIKDHPNVFLQPLNGIREIDAKNLEYVQGLLVKYPQFRLSVQLHKLLGWR
jgi:organic radical activating enzyme